MKNTENFDPNKVRKAVMIADTFTNLLNPINEEIPDLLLPVCNVPIIEYMIDFLFSNSIKEIIIVVKRQASVLQKYINKHYKKNKSIKLIEPDDITDMGDCLRKIYSEKLIATEFVLIRGLVIANFNLEKVFDYHMEKKKIDRNCILTSIFKKYKNEAHVKTKYDNNVVIYNTNTNQILQYESTNNDASKIELNDNVKFTTIKSTSNDQPATNKYTIRSDFYDTFIDICSVDVLNHFAENFDYHSIRDDLYRNVINSEIYVDQFYLYEITENDYVGVIKNFESYQKVTFEIVNRWAHPVVLEHLLISGKLDINYKTMNSNVYLDGESTIKGNINDATVVGSNSLIEQGATLSLCVLGKNTQIGKNAKLKKCIILSDCDIGQDVILDNVVIGNNVKIANKSVIKNCYIGDDVHLPEEEYFDQRIKIDRNDEDNLNSIEYIQNEAFIRDLDDKGLMFLEYQAEDDDEDDDESSAQEEEEEEEEDFDDEVKLIVNGGGKQEDIVLELISLQKAMFERTIYDTIKSCLNVLLQDFMRQHDSLFKNLNTENTRAIIGNLQELLIDWNSLFKKIIQTPDMQIRLIALIEYICIEHNVFFNFFHIILQILNSEDIDVLSDGVIKQWARSETSSYPTHEGEKVIDESHHRAFILKCKKFIDSL